MLPHYLIASILSLAIPSLAAPLAVVPQSVRFLTNFPAKLQPATRMKLEWEGEAPKDGWEVSVQPDLDGYEPLLSTEYVVIGEQANNAVWTTPAIGDWPSFTKFIICVYGEPHYGQWFDCSQPLKLSQADDGIRPDNVRVEFARNPKPKPKAVQGKPKTQAKVISHRIQKPVKAVKRSLHPPSRLSDLAEAQKSHNASNSQRLRRSLGLGGVMPLDKGRDSELSYLLGFGTDGVPTGMMAFP